VQRVLPVILFLFEPFLAAGLFLRVGPSLFERDGATWAGVVARVALALASVAAAIGLREARPYGRGLAIAALAGSALFAIIQYLTRVLPTSLAPDVAVLFTALVVLHHSAWMAWLMSSARSSRRGPRREHDARRPHAREETSRE